MFVLVGLGLKLEHLTLEALEIIKACDKVFLEKYTLDISYDFDALTKLTGKNIKLIERKDVESYSFLPLSEEKDKKTNKNVALLVFGDPLIATTHTELLLEAKQRGLETRIIHNISILNVISRTGLQPYKFGKIASIPFWQENIEYRPCGFYNLLEQNQKIGAHTLFLLDLNPINNKYLSPGLAIEMLIKCEMLKKKQIINEDTLFIVCSRLCSNTEKIVVGKYNKIKSIGFGLPPHCIIIPSPPHFKEQEFLSQFNYS